MSFFGGIIAMSIAYIVAGFMLCGLGTCYSLLYASKLIPALERWLIKKNVLVAIRNKRFSFLDAIMLILMSTLSLFGFALIVIHV